MNKSWLCLFLCACTEFAPPSALSKPQVLAIQADPPVVAPGERATLSALVADSGGVVVPEDLVWHVAQGSAQIEGAQFIAGTSPGTFVVTLEASVSGELLRAEKLVSVDNEPRANPRIFEVTVAGQKITALEARPGDSVDLEAVVSTSSGRINWYSTIGDVETFLGNTTRLELPPEPVTGTVFIVARDEDNGVAWQELAVETID